MPILELGLELVSEMHKTGAGASVPGGSYNCQAFAMFKSAKEKKKRFSLGGGEVESVGKKWEGRLVLCFRD